MIIPERANLKMAKGHAATDVNGTAIVKIKAPGDRLVVGGTGWFENPSAGDYIFVDVVDDDNLLGLGAGAVVGTFVDTEVAAANQGWYIPGDSIDIRPIYEFGKVPENLYLRIRAYHGTAVAGENFYCNIKWGAPNA